MQRKVLVLLLTFCAPLKPVLLIHLDPFARRRAVVPSSK